MSEMINDCTAYNFAADEFRILKKVHVTGYICDHWLVPV